MIYPVSLYIINLPLNSPLLLCNDECNVKVYALLHLHKTWWYYGWVDRKFGSTRCYWYSDTLHVHKRNSDNKPDLNNGSKILYGIRCIKLRQVFYTTTYCKLETCVRL